MSTDTKTVLTAKKLVYGTQFTFSGYSNDNYYHSVVNPERIYDEDVLAMLLTVAKNRNGQAILDVGANIGYITAVLAKFNPNSQVHAFEPVDSNVTILTKNIELNNCKNVAIHAFGLGNKDESVSLSWDPINRGSAFISNEPHEIYTDQSESKITTLDKEGKKLRIVNCGLIKVDIEGFELEFLRGARNFLQKYEPTVVMESNPWCLDALRNITVRDFLSEVLGIFTYVHAFWGNKLIDVREHLENYMHENIVNKQYMNLVCSFDQQSHEQILKDYMKKVKRLDYEKLTPEYLLSRVTERLEEQQKLISGITHENKILHDENNRFADENSLLRNATIRQSTAQLRKAIKRGISYRASKHKRK